MTNTSSLEAILYWYDALDNDIKLDIAALVLACLPRDEMRADSDMLIQDMRVWLTPHDSTDKKLLQFGRAISFGAIFEAIFAKRFSEEGWIAVREMQQDILDNKIPHFTDLERMRELAADILNGLPDRILRWQETGKKWRLLAEQYLGEAGADKAFFPTFALKNDRLKAEEDAQI